MPRIAKISNEGSISRLDAQDLKKTLNKEVKSLLDKVNLGTLKETEKVKLQALNKVRAGLKRTVEGGDEFIRQGNLEYNGFNSIIDNLTQKIIDSKKEKNNGFAKETIQSLIELMTGNKFSSATRMALKDKNNFEDNTKKLVKMKNKVNKLEAKKKPDSNKN